MRIWKTYQQKISGPILNLNPIVSVTVSQFTKKTFNKSKEKLRGLFLLGIFTHKNDDIILIMSIYHKTNTKRIWSLW